MQTGKGREGKKEGRKEKEMERGGGEREGERERSGYEAIISKMKLIKRDTLD